MKAGGGTEILLVEDDPNDAELIIRAFRKGRLTGAVVHLKDGAEAADYIMSNCCDRLEGRLLPGMILLDIKLPKLDGFEVLRKIRANVCTRNVPVVILTSSQEESDILKAYSLGANSYVTKPIDSDAFSKAMTDLGAYWLGLNKTLRTLWGGAR